MQKKKIIPDWQISLGESKKYHIFLVRNPLPLIPFIRKIQSILHKNLAFLGNYVPPETHADMSFLLFFAKILQEWDEYFILLPNRISVPPTQNSKTLIQGGFLFNDEQYLFNRQGQFLMACNYVDYDYVFLVLRDNDHPVGDIVGLLHADPTLDIQDISHLAHNGKKIRSGNLSKATDEDLLFNFFGNIEVMISDFRTNHLKCYLAPNQSIKSANIENPDIINQRFITAGLWRKEDNVF